MLSSSLVLAEFLMMPINDAQRERAGEKKGRRRRERLL